MKKILTICTVLTLMISLLGLAPAGLAQNAGDIPNGPPAGTPTGPSAEDIAQFEQEMGAPTAAYADIQTEPLSTEEVGKIPESVKQYVSEKDLVQIYCATARYKSGDFFSAMEAVKLYVQPGYEKAKELGIEVAGPDADALKAEGEKKLQAICGAATLDDAYNLTVEFKNWGESEGKGDFDLAQQLLTAKIKEKGDALRDKINTEIQGYVEEQKTKLEAEIKAYVDQLVETKKTSLQAMAESGTITSEDQFNAQLADTKSDITNQVNSFVKEKESALIADIRVKVNTIVGDNGGKFKALGAAFEGVSAKITAYIKAHRADYDKYKEEAFTLRKKIILNLIDENLKQALAKLEAAKADIDAAKAEDPSILSVDQIKAKIEANKQALIPILDAAMEAGDEAAFEKAITDFRTKWENYRTEMEKVATAQMNKACAKATAQFGPAKKQMQEGADKINKLMNECSGKTDDQCLKINEFAGRFNTILGKYGDLNKEISLAENLCGDLKPENRETLIALFKKIQADAENLKTFGEALEADKQKAIADSASKVCRSVLAQIKAVISDVESTDLPVFQNNIKKCQGKTTAECNTIRSLEAQTNEVMKGFNEFRDGEVKVRTLCLNIKDESDIQNISVILNSLKDKGEALKNKAKNLKVQLSQKASATAFCRAVLTPIGTAKTQVANGLRELAKIETFCKGNQSVACKNLSVISDKISALRNRSTEVNGKINTIEKECRNPNPVNPPSEYLIDAASYIRDQEPIVKKMVEDMKAAFSSLGVGGKGVWIEAESAVEFNTRLGVSNPMAREINPSWRPPYSGSGTWYMGAGKDYLFYNIAVPSDGKYKVWIRDYVDKFQPRGVRRVQVYFDGKLYGTFGETAASLPAGKDAIIAWHQVGPGVDLKIGSHTLKIVKESSTVGAAILDAYYLTTGNEAPTQ